MDVETYAPFTSSPLDASRGRGRRFMIPRLRPSVGITNRRIGESTPTVVLVLTPQPVTQVQQQSLPQLGGSTNGKNTK
jgi:hypothetical protein